MGEGDVIRTPVSDGVTLKETSGVLLVTLVWVCLDLSGGGGTGSHSSLFFFFFFLNPISRFFPLLLKVRCVGLVAPSGEVEDRNRLNNPGLIFC